MVISSVDVLILVSVAAGALFKSVVAFTLSSQSNAVFVITPRIVHRLPQGSMSPAPAQLTTACDKTTLPNLHKSPRATTICWMVDRRQSSVAQLRDTISALDERYYETFCSILKQAQLEGDDENIIKIMETFLTHHNDIRLQHKAPELSSLLTTSIDQALKLCCVLSTPEPFNGSTDRRGDLSMIVDRFGDLSGQTNSLISHIISLIIASSQLKKDKGTVLQYTKMMFQHNTRVDPTNIVKLLKILEPGYPEIGYAVYLWYLSKNQHKTFIDLSILKGAMSSLSVINIRGVTLSDVNALWTSSNASNIITRDIGDLLVNKLDTAREIDCLTVGLIVKALGVSRTAKGSAAWQSAMKIYNFARLAALAGTIKDLNKSSITTVGTGSTAFITGARQLQVPALPSIVFGQTVIILAKGGAELQTFQVMSDMLEAESIPSELTLDNVFLELSKHGAYTVMISLTERLKRYRVKLSPKAKNSVLNACIKVDAFHPAMEFFEKYMDVSELDAVALSVLIKCCDRTAQPNRAADIFYSASKAGMSIPKSLFQRLFAIFVKSKSSIPALKILLTMELLSLQKPYIQKAKTNSKREEEEDDNDSSIFTIGHRYILTDAQREKYELLETLSTDLDVDASEAVSVSHLSKLESLVNLVTSFVHPPMIHVLIYNAVIACLAKAGHADFAKSLLFNLIDRGMAGQLIENMFTSTLYGYRYTKDIVAAEEVFQKLKYLSQLRRTTAGRANLNRDALPVSEASYNALLLVYATQKNSQDRQKELLQEMSSNKLSWNVHTYTALIMGQQSDPDEVLGLWRQMMASKSIVPTTATIVETLKACVALKNGAAALEILELVSSHVEFKDELALQQLQLQQPGQAYSLAASPFYENEIFVDEETMEFNSNSNNSNSNSNSNKVNGIVGKQTAWVIQRVYVEMQMYLLTLIALNKQGGRSKDVLQLLSTMLERGIQPSEACYNVVIQALDSSTEWQDSVKIILQMVRKGMRVNIKLFNIVLSTCAKNQQWALVIKLFDSIQQFLGEHAEPSSSTYALAIASTSKLSETNKSLEIFNRMLSRNMLPSLPTIGQVITALERGERYEESSQVFQSVISCHLPVKDHNRKYLTNATSSASTDMVLDLHGYNIAIARACVRTALSTLRKEAIDLMCCCNSTKEYRLNSWRKNSVAGVRNMIIITGIGRNSKEWLEPVLKPSISSWLYYDFSPPLVANEIHENPGRLIVSGLNILDWAIQSNQTWLSRTFLDEAAGPIKVQI